MDNITIIGAVHIQKVMNRTKQERMNDTRVSGGGGVLAVVGKTIYYTQHREEVLDVACSLNGMDQSSKEPSAFNSAGWSSVCHEAWSTSRHNGIAIVEIRDPLFYTTA